MCQTRKVVDFTSCFIVDIIILIMIVKIHSFSTAYKCFNRCKFMKYSTKHSLLHQSNYYTSSALPKGSYFSDFMGLSDELERLRNQMIKLQKKETRYYSSIITLCLIIIGGGFLAMFFDKTIRIKLNLLINNILINFNIENTQEQLIAQFMLEIKTFLQQNPYQYSQVVKQLNDVMSFLQCRAPLYKIFQQQIQQVYSFILERNIRSVENQYLKKGVQKLTEKGISANFNVRTSLIEFLLLHGEVKQIYLATLYLERHYNNEQKSLILKHKQQINQNLQAKIKKNTEYYQEIFKKYSEQQLPQIKFKQNLQQKWVGYIKDTLRIDLHL